MVSAPISPTVTLEAPPAPAGAPERLPDVWTIVWWVGAAISVAGCAHLLPLWVPIELRDPDFVLATATQAAHAYPTLLLGLYLSTAGFAARARWRPLALIGGCLAALAIVVLGSGLVYAGTAMRAMHDLAGGDAAALAEFRRVFVRTAWFHVVAGAAALTGGVVAVECARHYRLRQRV